MAKLVDARDLKSLDLTVLRVRFPLWAPTFAKVLSENVRERDFHSAPARLPLDDGKDLPVVPKRIPAITDEVLRREAGMLADEALVLPQQMIILTGLSVASLKERMRTRPPKPPIPEPREKPGQAVWYSMGEVRRYRQWVAEEQRLNVVTGLRRGGFASFADWVNRGKPTDPWPIASLGPQKRPVDFWATLRGEVRMSRTDDCLWMTLAEFLHQRSQIINQEIERQDQKVRVAFAVRRLAKAGGLNVDRHTNIPPRERVKP